MKDLNFIPKSHIDKQNKQRMKSISILGGIATIAFLSIVSTIPIMINYDLSNTRDGVANQVQGSTGYEDRGTQVNILKNIYKQRESESKFLSSYGNDIFGILKIVEELLPKDVVVLKLKIDPPTKEVIKVSLECVAATENDVVSLINIVRKDKRFKEYTFAGYSRNTTQSKKNNKAEVSEEKVNYSFNITISILR